MYTGKGFVRRFEPWAELYSPYNGLANRRLQPSPTSRDDSICLVFRTTESRRCIPEVNRIRPSIPIVFPHAPEDRSRGRDADAKHATYFAV